MNTITVKLESRTLEVKKVPLGRYSELLKCLQELPKHLTNLDSIDKEKLIEVLPSIIADATPDVVRLFTVATDLSKEEAEALGLSEAVDVALAIIEVNEYFKVYEKIKKALAQPKEPKQIAK